MRKKIIMLLGILIALGLSSCGDRGDNIFGTDVEQQELPSNVFENIENAQTDQEMAITSSERNVVDDSKDSTMQPSDIVSEAEIEYSKMIINDFYGTINCVEEDGLLLVDTSRIMQMDSITLEVQKEEESTVTLLINPQTKTTEDTYLLMGESLEEWSFKLIEYDRDLHLKQIADIAEAVDSEREIMTCKLFSGGDKLLYNNINGLYLFDFASGKTTNLTQDGIFIYDFACLEQTGEILFSGSNSSEERVLGRVSMDGEKQQDESIGHLWGDIWAVEDFALIEEAELMGRGREGTVFRYDAEGGIRSFPLSDSDENGSITVSCHGAYYATRTTMEGESRYVIRIYSSKDGDMVKELPLTYEEYGDDFRLSGFLICDDVNRIILYGTWKGQETNTWIVSESL